MKSKIRTKRKISRSSDEEDEKYMLKAINIAERGVAKGQTPFGACIVCPGKNKEKPTIICAHNEVLKRNDPTAHAEIMAIRKASKKLGTISLKGCTIYSTTEPCPMCFSAIHWAKINRVVFSTKIADVKKLGFSEIPLSNKRMNKLGNMKMRIKEGVLREKGLELLKKWKQNKKKNHSSTY